MNDYFVLNPETEAEIEERSTQAINARELTNLIEHEIITRFRVNNTEQDLKVTGIYYTKGRLTIEVEADAPTP
jgi:hypothetical protein